MLRRCAHSRFGTVAAARVLRVRIIEEEASCQYVRFWLERDPDNSRFGLVVAVFAGSSAVIASKVLCRLDRTTALPTEISRALQWINRLAVHLCVWLLLRRQKSWLDSSYHSVERVAAPCGFQSRHRFASFSCERDAVLTRV